MKFLCLDCDAPMKLHSTEGPDEGSLAVTFRCPECGFRVAMLTNPFETQMVRSLGVKVGGRAQEPAPFEHLRTMMANPRADAFEGEGGESAAGPGCPFAAVVNDGAAAPPATVPWTSEAEARIERIPSFIRPMARRAIERFAADHGYATIDETVMDEARGAFGMQRSMTKADIVARMAVAAGWPKAGTERALRAALAGIRASLKRGDPVTLVGFGTFSVARRKPRTLKNPRTGQAVTVAGRIPRFKPSKELRQAVR